MSTLTSTRQDYLATHNTTDCQCLRIECEDGTVIRVTDCDIDLTVTTRIDRSGTSEAINEYTYFSIAEQLSAVNKDHSVSPNTMDLSMILGNSTAVESYTEEIEYQTYASSITSTFDNAANLSLMIDGDTETAAFTSSEGAVQADLKGFTIVFDHPITINKFIADVDPITTADAWGLLYSMDGHRFVRACSEHYAQSALTKFTATFPEVTGKHFFVYNSAAASGSRDYNEIVLSYTKDLNSRGYITESDILVGRLTNAKVYVFNTDFNNPVEDEHKMLAGYLGDITVFDNRFTAEMVSIKNVFDHRSSRQYSAKCDAKFNSWACGVHGEAEAWKPEMIGLAANLADASLYNVVVPSTENGYWYWPTTGGLTDTSEPTWNTTYTGSTNDGTVVWTTQYAKALTVAINTVTSSTRLELDDISHFPDDWFKFGWLEFKSGDLSGTRWDIVGSDSTGIDIAQSLPVLPSVSDTVRIHAGCDKTNNTCQFTFFNIYNFQGFPFIPGDKTKNKLGENS